MDEWLASLKANPNSQSCLDVQKILSGQHIWHATSHARPTYCNVCRDQLSGVTSHGLSCEICKCKVHKRCAAKAISNCKWTTLASVGKDIIEDKHGNILMPHQWMEGNLPVSAKCAVCGKTCGSVLRVQDWRCLWCRTAVHTACRPKHSIRCPLGPNHVSVVPPTAIHSIGTDDAWEAVRPHGCSPLLVFVNSKSGDNQGVKFLRRFRQILNPAQVFDLISSGPTIGLRLFRNFDPFRVLVCSGDGSVGWVLSEIDRLNMQLQCEVGVLPLGTGNDLARVLGWGPSCDDDTHLPQLLERYERASPKILDRWSVMVFERSIKVGDGGKLTLNTGLMKENELLSTAVAYEDSVLSHLTKILQSDQHSVLVSSAKILCETVKDFLSKISEVTSMQGDEDYSDKYQLLKTKLDHLLQVLKDEEIQVDSIANRESNSCSQPSTDVSEKFASEEREKPPSPCKTKDKKKLKKDQLLLRVNSLKKAVRCLVEHTEKAVDEQQFSSSLFPAGSPSDISATSTSPTMLKETRGTEKRQSLVSPLASIPNVTSISPLPEIRRDSSSSTDIHLVSLPVPKEFADSRHGSFADTADEKSAFLLDGGETTNCAFQFESNSSSNADLNRDKNEKSENEYFESEEGEEENEIGVQGDEDEAEEDDSEYAEDIVSKAQETDELIFGKNLDLMEEERVSERKFVGSLSEELAHIGHIDSSETSDDSPEASTNTKKGEDNMGLKHASVNQSSLRESIKEDLSFPISIDGVCNLGSELDMTNLFSTSPEEEEEECSEEYKREMGLDLKRCSLAHFIEGSDIARKSIKCRHRKKSLDDLDQECVAVAPEPVEVKCAFTEVAFDVPRIQVSNEDYVSVRSGLSIKDQINMKIRASGDNFGSTINDIFLSDQDLKPNRRSYALSLTDDEEYMQFQGLEKGAAMANSSSTGPTVIVEPPSPLRRREEEERASSAENDTKPAHETVRRLSGNCRRLSAASPLMSVHCSPSPTRRISNISLIPSDISHSSTGDKNTQQKALPIINPLVRLPQWPNVSEPGIIGKVLLANADALCAAAVPLMDPDEILMEGFFERCVMNNYFGIGIDAKISLDFHHKREEHPEKCRSRTRNYMWYGVLGSKQWLQKSCKNLEQRVQLECDGQRIPLPSLQGIVVLNIPSFMGGINFWGGTKEDDIFLAPSIDDHILEVVAVFGTVQMAASRLINLQHHRIAQCNTVQINILGEEGVPIEVDGEAWIQPPGMIRIIHKNRMKMLCRNKALESSLKAWEEKQRQVRHQNRLHSNIGKLTALTGDEMNILLGFIEATTSLIKYVKMLIIRHPSIEADLYQLAAAVGINLERVHPSGKILQGLELRPVVTELVISAQRLVEETNAVLRDKNLQIASEIERQLNSSMQQMEIELKKCFFSGSSQQSLVNFRVSSTPDEQEQKVAQGRKSSAGAFWQRFRRNSGISSMKYTRKEVSSWDVSEVATWLESIQLGEYADSFSSNDVRGRELLTLTRTDLKELGVSKVGHMKRLLLAIKEFIP